MSIKRINESFINKPISVSIASEDIDRKLKESYNKLVGLKTQYTEAVKKVNSLLSSNVKNSVTKELIECYKKAVDDLKIEFEDEKSTFEWYKKVKNQTLIEADVRLSPDIMYNPDAKFSLSDIAKKADADEKAAIAAQQEKERRAKAREAVASTIEALHQAIDSGEGTEDILDMLFEALVPNEGKADTVAGEIVRAMMRLLYRDYNDGDMFFEGYGLDTCASSAAYLMNQGFSRFFYDMMEQSHKYEYDGEAYTTDLLDIADAIIRELADNEDLFTDINKVDSRQYDSSEIEENQPRYSFEVYASDELIEYIDAEYCNSWKIKEYIEDKLSWDRAYDGAEVERPWGHYDTSAVIENLTRDGYDTLQRAFTNVDDFWCDLVDELKDKYGGPEDWDEDEASEEAEDDIYEALKEEVSLARDGFLAFFDRNTMNFIEKTTKELDNLMYVSKSDIPEYVVTELEDKGYDFDKDAVIKFVTRVLEGSIKEDLSIIKEPLVESEDEEEEHFTEEEQEEYEIDEYGYSLSGYDQYRHCQWCGEVFPEFEGKKELDMGWLCDRCVDAIKSRGEKMYFEE